jgi:hypothetical protein
MGKGIESAIYVSSSSTSVDVDVRSSVVALSLLSFQASAMEKLEASHQLG